MSAVGSILTNEGALAALQSISNTSTENNTLEGELSSGLAINSPADNPAGFITAQGFTSQLNGITQAISNANQGVSLLQTAQGALQQQIGIVQQLNSVAVQAANGTETPQEASSLQGVVTQLVSQVSSIASQTQFNNVSLLDGTFQNVQFQVGANEGQTLNLSINSTEASKIGLNTIAVSSLFTGGATNKNSTSALVTLGAAGGFTAGTFSVTGDSTGQTGTATITATESAQSIAAAFNKVSGATGVQAQASTTVTLNTAAGASGTTFSFKLQGSGSSVQTINAANASDLVSQINGNTGATGITAALSSTGQVTLTQANGANISITNVAVGGTDGVLSTTGSAPKTIVAAGATIQGQVQFQSSAGFTTGGTAKIGFATTGAPAASTLDSLANINVSTVNGSANGGGGANQAINVIKFALQSLNNTGGQLGAVQQGLTANINNLNATSQNATTALGVVQDANLPQVANQLTQAQIQAQAGVAALKSSTTLQQSFLSLLP